MAKKRRHKENSRTVAYAFRTTEEIMKDLERVSKECSRTKSLQCEYFVKEGIKQHDLKKVTDGRLTKPEN